MYMYKVSSGQVLSGRVSLLNYHMYTIKALRVLMGTAVFKRASLQIGLFLV